MKTQTATNCVILGLIGAGSVAAQESSDERRAQQFKDSQNRLWYEAPGTQFMHGLPLGNGRLGMTITGGVHSERILLNEESMWNGSAADDNREDAHKNLPEIRKLLIEGQNAEAQALVMDTFICKGKGSGHGPGGGRGSNVPFGCYQVLGNMHLTHGGQGAVTEYRRDLDLSKALATVSYRQNGTLFAREYFVSAPDQLGVIRLVADKAGAITFSLRMDRIMAFSTKVVKPDLLMKGSLNDGKGGTGTSYSARVRIVNTGGKLEAKGESLQVIAADEVLIYFSAETDYHGNAPRDRIVTNPEATTAEVISAAQKLPFDKLLNRHTSEHAQWYNRCSLSISDGKAETEKSSNRPTDQRLLSLKEGGADPALAALYFNYGRYLLIASSRPGTLPANLQGIWAENINPPWNCDYHLNINVQMNYWLSELVGLGECHMPLLKLVKSLQESGAETAKAYYNSEGWLAYVITNPWGYTAPGEHAGWGSTSTGAAWLCDHLWERYAFTRDVDYLKWAYPIMKGAATLYSNVLMEEPKNGWLVTGPSTSPENGFIDGNGDRVSVCFGPTMDMQLLRELFGNCIQAAKVLGQDQEFARKLSDIRCRLAPNQIGSDGRLMEWLEEYREPDPTHRHVSHLYGLHPFDEISVDGTPALADAARKSLEKRGDKGTGWSLAWKVNFWARLHDGNRAEKLLRNLLKPTGAFVGKHMGERAGTYLNLFCAHPPFQIDGNLGGASGIAEMLLQSRWSGVKTEAATILLLPALPDAWPEGEVHGLRARKGISVEMRWKAGRLQEAKLLSDKGATVNVIYAGHARPLVLKAGVAATLSAGSFEVNGKEQ